MEFEYDPSKSDSNRAKHGLDFEAAQKLWEDDFLLKLPAKDVNEPRYMVIGLIEGKHWTAIATDRGEAVRIISVRRSHGKEEKAYERSKDHR